MNYAYYGCWKHSRMRLHFFRWSTNVVTLYPQFIRKQEKNVQPQRHELHTGDFSKLGCVEIHLKQLYIMALHLSLWNFPCVNTAITFEL